METLFTYLGFIIAVVIARKISKLFDVYTLTPWERKRRSRIG